MLGEGTERRLTLRARGGWWCDLVVYETRSAGLYRPSTSMLSNAAFCLDLANHSTHQHYLTDCETSTEWKNHSHSVGRILSLRGEE